MNYIIRMMASQSDVSRNNVFEKTSYWMFSFLLVLILAHTLLLTNASTTIILFPQETYFQIVTLFAIIILSIYCIRLYKIVLNINLIDIFVFLYFIYFFFRAGFSTNVHLYFSSLLNYVVIFLFYFTARIFLSNNKVNYSHIFIVLIVFAIIHSIYCIIIYIENLIGNNLPAAIKGFFENSGVLANFLVAIISIPIGIIFFRKSNKFQFILALFALIFTIIAIIIVQARTSWFAVIICILYFLKNHSFFKSYIDKSSKIFKLIAVIGILFISIILVNYVYNLKPLSVSGRVFIWKICGKAICEKPLFGHGIDRFQYTYNYYQSLYFSNGNGSEQEKMLAGDGLFAFNDFIQIIIEQGFFGFLIFILLIISLTRVSSNNYAIEKIFLGCIISIIVCSLFSYPLQRLSTLFLFFLFITIISSNNINYVFKLNSLVSKTLLILTVVITILLIIGKFECLKYNKLWKKAYNMQLNESAKSLKIYNDIYSYMKNNSSFLYNYGNSLLSNGENEKCKFVLEKASQNLNNSNLYMLLGDVYENTGNYVLSQKYFELASFTVPHLFYPRYRLILLYHSQGLYKEAYQSSVEMMKMKEKIPLPVVDKMKEQIKTLMINDTHYKNMVDSVYFTF